MNRAEISNYINKSISHFQSEGNSAETRAERRRLAKTVRAHEKFRDKFESTTGGTTDEVLSNGYSRKMRKMLGGAAMAAVGPAVVVASGVGLLPFIGLAGFLGCVAGLGVGVAAMAAADYNETKFANQVEVVEKNVKADKGPDPELGNVPVSMKSSDADDGFGELGISHTGKPGIGVGGGLMIDMDGKVGLSLT